MSAASIPPKAIHRHVVNIVTFQTGNLLFAGQKSLFREICKTKTKYEKSWARILLDAGDEVAAAAIASLVEQSRNLLTCDKSKSEPSKSS